MYKYKAINILLCVVDTLVCALAILIFAWCAKYFERWWIVLFSLVPLMLFNGHTLILDRQIEAEGGENDGNDR